MPSFLDLLPKFELETLPYQHDFLISARLSLFLSRLSCFPASSNGGVCVIFTPLCGWLCCSKSLPPHDMDHKTEGLISSYRSLWSQLIHLIKERYFQPRRSLFWFPLFAPSSSRLTSQSRSAVMEFVLHHGIKFVRNGRVPVIVDAALGENVGDLLPRMHRPLARMERTCSSNSRK